MHTSRRGLIRGFVNGPRRISTGLPSWLPRSTSPPNTGKFTLKYTSLCYLATKRRTLRNFSQLKGCTDDIKTIASWKKTYFCFAFRGVTKFMFHDMRCIIGNVCSLWTYNSSKLITPTHSLSVPELRSSTKKNMHANRARWWKKSGMRLKYAHLVKCRHIADNTCTSVSKWLVRLPHILWAGWCTLSRSSGPIVRR